jgi:large subunit ribosomal protein L31
MKPGIHPDYHPVVFQDATTGDAFLTRSTITSERTIDWKDGPHISPRGGGHQLGLPSILDGITTDIDTAGQVEKFRRRYGDRS